MATTFHHFSRLPSELRTQIWKLADCRRLVHISITETAMKPWKRTGKYDFASPTPPPALMHACQESRQCTHYQKAFFTTVPDESEVRYIWVNFEQDMICVEDYNFSRLWPHEADIQRLRFMIPTGRLGDLVFDWFGISSGVIPDSFTALRELQIAIAECFLIWGSTWGSGGYEKCPREIIKFLDLHTGLLLTGPQLEMAYNWSWLEGGRVLNMDTLDEDHEFAVRKYTDFDLSLFLEVD